MDKKAQKTDNSAILYFDGGSRGNPGRAAGAAVIVLAEGNSLTTTRYMERATNNEAEYTGLIIGLEKAQELGLKSLEIRGDSQLVIKSRYSAPIPETSPKYRRIRFFFPNSNRTRTATINPYLPISGRGRHNGDYSPSASRSQEFAVQIYL